MTLLPIVERELRIAARLPATYRNRTIAAGVVMLAAVAVLGFGIFAKSASRAGGLLFHTLSFLTLLFCAAEGARKTADCLSEEKREGTLGLLFLTDLKGYDVVLGKLVATSLNSVYGLFAILPVLSLPILVGGVLPGEFWRMALALANILFFSLCTGMLVSAWSRHENRAMSVTLFLVLVFMLVPGLTGISGIDLLSPRYAYTHSFAVAYSLEARGYWQSLGITQALSWLMLGVASVMLPRWWQEVPANMPRRFSLRQFAAPLPSSNPYRMRRRTEMLETNPVLWLAGRDSGRRFYLWGLAVVTAVSGVICLSLNARFVVPVFLSISWIVNFILKMSIAAQACHCLAEAKRNNALEMLLATPLTVSEIINGQILALRNTFLAPAIAIMVVELSIALAQFGLDRHNSGSMQFDAVGMVFLSFYFALCFLDIVAVTWAGMWFGLTAPKETRAATKTILLVLVLPYASLLICWYGLPFFIGIPIFWIGWCSSKLKTEFRTLAAQRFTPPPTGSGWLPGIKSRLRPPVISR